MKPGEFPAYFRYVRDKGNLLPGYFAVAAKNGEMFRLPGERHRRLEEEMENAKNLLLEKINEAEMVLVGIGEEFGENVGKGKAMPQFADCFRKIEENGQLLWMLPYMEKMQEDSARTEKTEKAYEILEKLLKDKNYFIVSTRMDDYIYRTNLKKEKVVTPCGGYRFLQCEDGCGKRLYPADGHLPGEIYGYLTGKDGNCGGIQPQLCPECGKRLVFNNRKAVNYIEEGYLEQWNKYMQWLKGTVNKKLCLLELGAGMQYPTVIRWPFERLTFINEKSNMFRVHSKLYHLAEEIKGRGYKIQEKPIDFLINWFV